jgi:uncharacterized protein (TIGR02757 family)
MPPTATRSLWHWIRYKFHIFFTKKEDIEIAGFLSASIAWGQRPVILKNAKHLMQLMEYEPYDFIMNHRPADRIGFSNFRHRTMLPADILFFLTSLQNIYRTHKGLEKVFTTAYKNKGIKHAITQFHATFLRSIILIEPESI